MSRAQRLSASEIQHEVIEKFAIKSSECSTPFGIRDSTQLQLIENLALMLCSTPFGIRDSTPRESKLPVDRLISAQRLSASEIQHIDESFSGNRLAVVLNAFRHQRFNTAIAQTLIGAITVINHASTSLK